MSDAKNALPTSVALQRRIVEAEVQLPPSPEEDRSQEYDDYRRSERWRNLRRVVRLRAGGKCEACLRANGSELHHLTYERFGNERLTDVIWICDGCHQKLHPERRGRGAFR
jgi:5-methylcytosine-specific restriction endonuclease McrA